MVTTTQTDDYLGRDLTTPDTDARDYLNRATIAGDRDFMGRLLTGGAEGGGAQALLDEAAVRFDFSQYDDTADMVDVNGGVGPLFVQIQEAPVATLVADGLQVEAGAADSLFLTWGEEEGGLSTPLSFGPDGMTVMDVVSYTTQSNHPFSRVRLVADAGDEQYPELGWSLKPSPDEPWGDELAVNLYDTPDTYDTIYENTPVTTLLTPFATSGVFFIIGVIDVAEGEMRWTEVTPLDRADLTLPFDKIPPDFAAVPAPVNMIDIKANIDTPSTNTIIRVEWLAWDRVLTPSEVDALVAHFTT